MDVDALIDFCAACGEIDGMNTLAHVGKTYAAPLSVCVSGAVRNSERRNIWTDEETAFVQDHLETMTLAEIGAALGRSENAIKIRIVRKQIPVASKRPGYLTGNQVAKLFRVDVHAVMAWRERGIMAIDTLPGNREIMSVHIKTVYRWAVRAENWIYFKAERIRDGRLRKMVELAQARWGDEWWTTGQVAAYHGVDVRLVVSHVYRGKLNGVRWGNWRFLRSEAIKHRFYTGKGGAARGLWSPGADAWILRARDELGMQFVEIARRMKGDWDVRRVMYRYGQLKSITPSFVPSEPLCVPRIASQFKGGICGEGDLATAILWMERGG